MSQLFWEAEDNCAAGVFFGFCFSYVCQTPLQTSDIPNNGKVNNQLKSAVPRIVSE